MSEQMIEPMQIGAFRKMNKTSKIEKLNSLFLATAPMWAIYDILQGNSLATIFIWILVILNIFTRSKICLKNREPEIQLFKAILAISIFGLIANYKEHYFNTSYWINNLYSIISCFIAIFICSTNVNIRTYIRAVKLFGILASIIVIFQKTQYIIGGTFYQNFFIPGLSLYRDMETFSMNRPCAFFTEPAHLSIFLLPIFYMFLNFKEYLFSIIIFIAILCSGSTSGFVLSGVLIMMFMIKQGLNFTHFFIAILITVIVIILTYHLFPFLFETNINRLINSDENVSFALRLLGPLQYISDFNSRQWFFGIGFNQLSDYIVEHGSYMVTEFDEYISINYANAILFMFISYGIIGLFFLFIYLFKRFKYSKVDIGYFVIFLGILCSDQILFNMNLLYLLSFVLLLPNIDEKQILI